MNKLTLASCAILVTGCALKIPGIRGGNSQPSSSSGASEDNSGVSENASSNAPVAHRAVDCSKVKVPDEVMPPPTKEENDWSRAERYFARDYTGSYEMLAARAKYAMELEAELATAPKRSAEYWCGFGGNFTGGKTPHERAYLEATDALAKFVAAQKAQAPKEVAALDAMLARVDARLAEYKQVPTLRLDGDDLGTSGNDIVVTLNREGAYHVGVLEIGFGAKSPDAVAARARLDQAHQKVKAVAHEIDEQLTDQRPAPKDTFHGGDAGSIKAAFKKYIEGTGRRVVTVALVSPSWDRKTGSEWRGSNLEKYDHSFLTGEVVTKLDEKTGEVLSVVVRKDHLDGNKYKFDVAASSVKGKLRLAKISGR